MDGTYKVVVHEPWGDKMIIDLCNTNEQMQSMTVLQLKEKIAERLPGGPVHFAGHIPLMFKDRMLDEDSSLLSEYGIQHMSDIYMVYKIPGGSSIPGKGDGGMGDDENRSMEWLTNF